jgi:hypothetical protein
MGFFQAEGGRPWLGAFIFERSTRNVADPQSSHELQTWQSAQLLVVPLSQGGVLGVLPNDGILDDGITEMVDYRGDRKDAPESFVKSLLCHSCSSMGLGAVDDDLYPAARLRYAHITESVRPQRRGCRHTRSVAYRVRKSRLWDSVL